MAMILTLTVSQKTYGAFSLYPVRKVSSRVSRVAEGYNAFNKRYN
jgi:hypothetical protein